MQWPAMELAGLDLLLWECSGWPWSTRSQWTLVCVWGGLALRDAPRTRASSAFEGTAAEVSLLLGRKDAMPMKDRFLGSS